MTIHIKIMNVKIHSRLFSWKEKWGLAACTETMRCRGRERVGGRGVR